MLPLNSLPYPQRTLNHERVRLRKLNIRKSEEIARLPAIEEHEPAKKYMVGRLHTDSQFKWFAKGDRRHITFGLSGKRGHVTANEVGKLQGWIHIYNDVVLRRNIQKLLKRQSLKTHPQGKNVLEVSFAKYPLAKGGQVSSGLRQTCRWLTRHLKEPELKIAAFTAKDNVTSIRVLKAAGFRKLDEIKYSDQHPHRDLVFILLR